MRDNSQVSKALDILDMINEAWRENEEGVPILWTRQHWFTMIYAIGELQKQQSDEWHEAQTYKKLFLECAGLEHE